MKYIFEIHISTDGDFCFPFIPCDMNHVSGSNEYSFQKVYNDKDASIEDVSKICTFLKEQMHTSRGYVREMFDECIDSFMQRVCKADNTINVDIRECMSGNYDGTEFCFCVQPNCYNFSLRLTDEEYELIRKHKGLVSLGQIKTAVLALFK